MRNQTTLAIPQHPPKARDYAIRQIRSRRDVNSFLEAHHYYHRGVPGWKFVLGMYNGSELCGVIVLGHPTARKEDHEHTLEIVRIAFAPGAPKNSPSRLIGAAKRRAQRDGYSRIITYADTALGHDGGIYKAAGFKQVGETRPHDWSCPSRPRPNSPEPSVKLKFEWIDN